MSQDALKAHLEYFGELGVDGMRADPLWRSRSEPALIAPTRESALAPTGVIELAPTNEVVFAQSSVSPLAPTIEGAFAPLTVFASPSEALRAIREDIGDCTRCKLHTLGRTQVVFGVGNPEADLMFVGEAPGADEDVKGEPFVGRAGQLLTKIIEAIGMTREQVYIANLIKCRPPGNRNPEPDEMAQCEPFLFRQIDTIKPRVIVALGKFSAQTLLRTQEPITKLRGREFTYRDSILMPTYHPAYLLRTPSAKREVWDDMKRVKQILEERRTVPGS